MRWYFDKTDNGQYAIAIALVEGKERDRKEVWFVFGRWMLIGEFPR